MINFFIGYAVGILVGWLFPFFHQETTDVRLTNTVTGEQKVVRIKGTGTMATIVDMTPDIDLGDDKQ